MDEENRTRRPVVLYDGACGFCKIWIEYWKRLTGDRLEYAASQERGAEFPQIAPEDFAKSVQLVAPDGAVSSGAKAVYGALEHAGGKGWLKTAYEASPAFAAVSEAGYRTIAAHRNFFYRATVLTFGKRIEPSTFARTEWLFLRLLGLVYFFAFASLAPQVRGLLGVGGITPAGRFLDAVKEALGAEAYWRVPSLFWMNSTDEALTGVCWVGAALGLALLCGASWSGLRATLYVLYLSICVVGQDFLSFQWDALLLEVGFLAIFLGRKRLVVWMFRWLLFRLMFMSGYVKLLSHDPAWRNLTALDYHYYTQPLPMPLAWYFQQAPEWFHRVSTGGVFFVELGLPILIFAPRRLRHFGAGGMIALQVLILLTGNYAFFNLLALALCLFLFDDRALDWRWLRRMAGEASPLRSGIALRVLAALILLVGASQIAEGFIRSALWPLALVQRFAGSLEIVNPYGLFAVMTTERIEIVIQGSNDGATWKDYELPYKPQDLKRRPEWVAPYQPRLDWQMWFAALGNYRNNPWFVGLMKRVLDGEPAVLKLFRVNPFPGAPPRYTRALAYEYTFTNWAERKATGDWWKRTPRGEYLPTITLESFQRRR